VPPDVSGKFCALASRGRLAKDDYFKPLRLRSLYTAQFDHSFGIEE
jgi:hypothetical protein